MGEYKEGYINIVNWLKSDRVFEIGVLLYERFGKNKNLKKLFPGKENRYANKLAWELAKTIGININDFQNNSFGDAPADVNVNKSFTPAFTPHTPIFSDKSPSEYPPMIRKVMHLYKDLYKKRSLLHKEMADLPQNNDPINVDRRKDISDQMQVISTSLEPLYEAKKNYLENNILPEELNFEEFESVLNDQVKSKTDVVSKKEEIILAKMAPEDLVKKRTNLRTNLTKQKNMLEYQHTSAKDKEPKPMPEGPKRIKVMEKISEIENQLSEIDTLLDADKPE